jgi:hypothetical protein
VQHTFLDQRRAHKFCLDPMGRERLLRVGSHFGINSGRDPDREKPAVENLRLSAPYSAKISQMGQNSQAFPLHERSACPETTTACPARATEFARPGQPLPARRAEVQESRPPQARQGVRRLRAARGDRPWRHGRGLPAAWECGVVASPRSTVMSGPLPGSLRLL